MTFRKLRIGHQLAISFGFIAVLLLAVIFLTYGRIASLNANIGMTNSDLYPKTILAHRIKDKVNEAVISMRNALLISDPVKIKAELDSIETGARVIVASINEIDKTTAGEQGRQYVAGLVAARQKFVAARTHFAQTLLQDKKSEAAELLFSEVLPAQQGYFEQIDGMIALQQQRMTDNVQSSGADAQQTQYLLLGISLLALLLGALIAWYTTVSITTPLARAVAIARTVADGDLSSTIEVDARNETGQLLAALHDMNEGLLKIVSQVRSGTAAIASASSQIAAGNADLSSRTEQQAGSLEETVSAMDALTSTVRQNADNATQANQLATSASDIAVAGGNVVREVVATMNSISESSKKIVDIISVIDGIAFQTNILALNAAVEAARAGEQGRGFAVVAQEVRTLAQRSASAAKEIKTLIGDSVEKVGSGTVLVEQAGVTMTDMVASVKRVTDIVGEISAASREQSNGLEEVNQAIGQMDKATQQNAALVEEAAGASSSMQQQTALLAQLVSVFRLGDRYEIAESAPLKTVHGARQAVQVRSSAVLAIGKS
ncbi:methyl-accepting chemotaxis protein [Herbaspirillum rhizosphaerae]|uniref:methyl-accepting chemotaxis protein n=1 Tax=Herbaspirillum rhizosphaerae TaxID=346179 RepID=UPI00067E1EFF|nr:methyl-accepting chemotaxis protein [Herbaspirillum rhizosphaerae]